MGEEIRRYRVLGRVQGVFYRATTRRWAEEYDLVGYVKNKEDGSVEVVAQGATTSLDLFYLKLLEGSRFSKVDKIEPQPVTETVNRFDDFEIRY